MHNPLLDSAPFDASPKQKGRTGKGPTSSASPAATASPRLATMHLSTAPPPSANTVLLGFDAEPSGPPQVSTNPLGGSGTQRQPHFGASSFDALFAASAATVGQDDDTLDDLLAGTSFGKAKPATSSMYAKGSQPEPTAVASVAPSAKASHSPPPQKQGAARTGASRTSQSSSNAAATFRYSNVGDVCCDGVTAHHILCFPCAVDDVYRSMNDQGFCPGCSVCLQMSLFALAPPLYYVCCCAQAYAVRGKFNVIIGERESSEGHGCGALWYPYVLTAQIHREIELRGQQVVNGSPCSGGDDSRVYKGDVYAPSMPDMMTDGRRPPYLSRQVPFGGGALSADESLSLAKNEANSPLSVVLPVVTENACCGKKVMYNSWRHWLYLCAGLPADLFCGVFSAFQALMGGG